MPFEAGPRSEAGELVLRPATGVPHESGAIGPGRGGDDDFDPEAGMPGRSPAAGEHPVRGVQHAGPHRARYEVQVRGQVSRFHRTGGGHEIDASEKSGRGVQEVRQGLEHGPSDFFPNPEAIDTSFPFRLAVEGRYSAIALGVGLAEKYMGEHAGRIPLILKLNGKTNIPDDAEAVSPAFASVEDAVRLGADAVGYTVYVGSPRQDVEIQAFGRVRQDCERLGMPLVVWAYPRGRAIEAKGGKGSLFAQDYAARVAEELGFSRLAENSMVGSPRTSRPRPSALVSRSRIQRLSLSSQNLRRCRLGRKRRLVLLLACETLLPTIGALPVI